MEAALNELVNEFLEAIPPDGGDPPNFDRFPLLQRLLERTFDSGLRPGVKRRVWIFGSWWTLGAVMLPVLAFVWLPLFEHQGGSRDCLWRTPDWIRDLVRTPVNCSVCENLIRVDRVEGVLDPEAFMRHYVDIGKPVVVTDVTKRWLARKTFSFDFFRSTYSNKSRANCQFFRYRSKFESLQHVFETASVGEGVEPWYVGW